MATVAAPPDDVREAPKPAAAAPADDPKQAAAAAAAAHSPEVQAHYRSILWIVVSLSLLWAIESGIDSGIGPCSFTTLAEKLDASVTSITVAQTMAEVTKTVGSVVVAVFTTSAAVQNAMVCAGGLIMAGGTLLVGIATNVATVGAGFFFIGLGLSFLAVLCPAILEYYVVSRPHRHKVVFYLTIVYAGASLGVAVAFGMCGATIEMAWRWNYAGAAILLLPIVGSVAMADRWAAHTRKLLPPSELSELALPQDDPAASAVVVEGASPPGSPATPAHHDPVLADALAAAALKLKPRVMPWWRIWLHTKVVLEDRCFRWVILFETASSFYVTAYVVLLPVFLEHEYGLTKGEVAAVLASLIPATALGLIASGVLVKHYRWGLERQLQLILVTSVLSIPIAFGFFLPFVPFLVVLVLGMFVVFANIGPSRTIFPLIIDAALMVAKLHDAIEAHERLQSGSANTKSAAATVAALQQHHHHGGGSRKEDDNELLGWSAAKAAKPSSTSSAIRYVDEDDEDKRRDHNDGDRSHASATAAAAVAVEVVAVVEVHPGVQSQADVIAREVLVAHVNALTNVFHRVLGSVPGPIILAALVDHTDLPRSWSFFIVGFVAMCLGALGAYMSWVESPERRQPIKPASADDRRGREEDNVPKERIVYVDVDDVDGGGGGDKGRQRAPRETGAAKGVATADEPLASAPPAVAPPSSGAPRKIDHDDI